MKALGQNIIKVFEGFISQEGLEIFTNREILHLQSLSRRDFVMWGKVS